MKRQLWLMCAIAASSALGACNQSIKSKVSLKKYLNDTSHGLKQERRINKIEAGLTYVPWQAIASRLYNEKHKDTSAIKMMKTKYYFLLGLSANGKELLRQLPFDQYSEMVQVLAFRLRPYVNIVRDDGKIIGAEDCLFQQTYGAARENEVLLVFNGADLKNARRFNLKINEFGLNTGNLDYQIEQKDTNALPDIEINEH